MHFDGILLLESGGGAIFGVKFLYSPKHPIT
jgi:hypothetical protein